MHRQIEILLTPLNALFGRVLWAEKLARNPLYSDRLYSSPTKAATRGIYNAYVLSFVVFFLLAIGDVFSGWFCLFLGVSLLVAMCIDRTPWPRKLAPTEMPRQLGHYLILLVKVIKTDLLVLLIASGLVFGLVKPYTSVLDIFAGHTFLVLYGLYFFLRLVFLVFYLFVVRYRWQSYRRPPFEIRKANLRDQETATRHLLWSFFLGNLGLVVRCGYYDMMVGVYERFYVVVGYPALGEYWVLIVGAVLILWILLGDRRLAYPYYKAHRYVHENRVLYTSVHRIHHCGIYPTQLDSGTENPAEFLITESHSIWFAPLPDWFWFIYEIWHIKGHLSGHKTRASGGAAVKYYQFHVLHHRQINCNYGYPFLDEKFDTALSWADFHSAGTDP